MKADISRDTFQAVRAIRRVVAQQGRPWLDSDWNEQVAVLLHRLETLAADIFGEHAAIGNGFNVASVSESGATQLTFAVAPGRYYVHGLMCENETLWAPPAGTTLNRNTGYLIVLHAWEEYEPPAEDAAMMDPALRGIETSGRTRVRWEVRWQEEKGDLAKAWNTFRSQQEAPPARLRLRLDAGQGAGDPSHVQGRSVYRGVENTLYRVEVHSVTDKGARVKWGRDNSSMVLPVSAEGATLRCLDGGELSRSVQAGTWIELYHERKDGSDSKPHLHKVQSVDREANEIQLDAPVASGDHLFARPWIGVQDIKLQDPKPLWIPLGDGLEFTCETSKDAELRRGQYWLLPIRTEGGGRLFWPIATPSGPSTRWVPLDDQLKSLAGAAPHEPDRAGHGTAVSEGEDPLEREHYYGPLATLKFDGAGTATVTDLRGKFIPFSRR
jgi:hypothetical protein